MLAQNISSALIIESDADWDMRIKRSAHGFSEGARKIVDFPFTPALHQIGEQSQKQIWHPRHFAEVSAKDPYGDAWDLLYLGTCGSKIVGDGRVYAYNDPAAPPSEHTSAGGLDEEMYPRKGTTRFVFQPDHAGCTVGYAISNSGARKFVEKYFQNMNQAVDMQMQHACFNDPNMTCVSTFPPIISQADTPSNMGDSSHEDQIKSKVKAGNNIQISARVNADSGFATLGPGKWKKEWESWENLEDDAIL